MNWYGWCGRLIDVDLSHKKIGIVPLDPDTVRLYLGGRGLGVYLVYNELNRYIDPLSADNLLVFAAGPLTGTPVPTTGRFACVSKSPLTGTILDSNCGGRFGPYLKFAGYDAIIVRGASRTPVYIRIADDVVSIEDARSLWSKNVRDTTAALKEYGSVLCIGTAGERLVRFASIMNDNISALGRGGLGAVMGSKNLKAIVVNGSNRPKVYDPNLLRYRNADITRLLVASPVSSKGLRVYGTPVLMNLINYMKVLPTANFRRSTSPHAYELSGERIHERFGVKLTPCYGCPIACKREIKPSGVEVPEYETLAMLGTSCEVTNLNAIIEANHLCNDYGMDTISCGATIACYAELNNLQLDPGTLISLVHKIGTRKDVGDELAEGAHRYASKMGHPELSMDVKGLELPGYDPRGVFGMALGYATSNRGGCHTRAYIVGMEIFGKPKLIHRLSWVGKPNLVALLQNIFAAVDSTVMCKFALFSVSEEEIANALSAVTGIDFTSEDFIQVGERIWNLERLFNLREGFTKLDDTLPERFFQEDTDVKRISKSEFMSALLEYYRARDWTKDGIPTHDKLQALSIAGEYSHVA